MIGFQTCEIHAVEHLESPERSRPSPQPIKTICLNPNMKKMISMTLPRVRGFGERSPSSPALELAAGCAGPEVKAEYRVGRVFVRNRCSFRRRRMRRIRMEEGDRGCCEAGEGGSGP